MNTPVDPKAAEATATPAEPGTQVAIAPPRRNEVRVVIDPIAVLDTARFEQMQRVANVMASCNFIPDALCMVKVVEENKDGSRRSKMVRLEHNQILSNCFMTVNQAVRWGMDPFAVAQCVSVVHGKLCYEGKLIAGLIDAKLGIRLHYEWAGTGEDMRITVSGTFKDGITESIQGTVKEWKTSHAGSPWTPLQYRKMLAYRGAREWARLYAPGLMLGVYSPDEMEALSDDNHTSTTITRDALPPPPPRPRRPTPPTPPAAGDVTTTAPADSEADTSFVELATGPSSRPPAEQSRAATTGTSPAESSSQPPTAGEAFLSKTELLGGIGACTTIDELDKWFKANGGHMGNLDGADGREVENAYNRHESALRNPKQK